MFSLIKTIPCSVNILALGHLNILRDILIIAHFLKYYTHILDLDLDLKYKSLNHKSLFYFIYLKYSIKSEELPCM